MVPRAGAINEQAVHSGSGPERGDSGYRDRVG